MLLLDRRHGESILVGDDIRVTIFQRPGNRVCVGVSAPRDLPVHREEIYRRLQSRWAPRDDSTREAPRQRYLRLPARPRTSGVTTQTNVSAADRQARATRPILTL